MFLQRPRGSGGRRKLCQFRPVWPSALDDALTVASSLIANPSGMCRARSVEGAALIGQRGFRQRVGLGRWGADLGAPDAPIVVAATLFVIGQGTTARRRRCRGASAAT